MRNVRVIILFLMLCASLGWLSDAMAGERRVALVIGNGEYVRNAKLPNPSRDASALAKALEQLGFKVITGIDLNQSDIRLFVSRFGREARRADVALVFYAGHGIQLGNENYLVPIDADASEESDARLLFLPLQAIQEAMASAKTRIVFLDACRDNPLARQLVRTVRDRPRATAASVRPGLAAVDLEDRVGSFIAFATAPGQVAADGEGDHSPFAAALLQHIASPGKTISEMMIDVRRAVLAATDDRQTPWENSSLNAPFRFQPIEPPAAAAAPREPVPGQGQNLGQPVPVPVAEPNRNAVPTAPPSEGMEIALWNTVKDSSDAEDFEDYLKQFPNGKFARIAQRRLKRLNGEGADTVAAAPATAVPAPPPGATKSGTQAEPEPPVEVAAAVDRSIEMKRFAATELEGTKYASPPVTSFEECADACRSTPRCHAVEFYAVNKTCGLFDTVPRRAARAGVETALKLIAKGKVRELRVRKLERKYVEGEGYDTTRESSFEECAERCLHDGRCKMMEFYAPAGKCNLFAHTRALKADDDDALVGLKE